MESNVLIGPPTPSECLGNINLPANYFILKCVDEFRNSVCMVDAISGALVTFDSIISDSITIAAELQTLGCKPGYVVGIMSENRLEYPAILLAVLNTGATATCFNPAYSIGELEHTLNITQPFVIFTSSYSSDKLQKLRKKCKSIKYVIHIDDKPSSRDDFSYKVLLGRKGKAKYTQPKVTGENTTIILFSSGSTGLPKGVMLSNKSIVFLLELVRFRSKMLMLPGEQRVSLSVIPMFHGYGVLNILGMFINGGKIINLSKFDEELFLSAISRYKVTTLSLVPALMVFIAKHPLVDNYDFSSVKEITCGAAPLSPAIEEEVIRKLKLPNLIKGYGMTETTMVCITTTLSEYKPGSVGQLGPAMLAKIIDTETGENLGPHKEGEICLKGILIMQGYYNNEEETKAAIDQDGWLHTGDVAYYDEDGDFFIVDRIKDLIKYKGFQVAPAELEALLLKHEAVKDAAVVGVPDEIAGEVPRAFVVKQKDVTEQEIQDHISSNVAPHMKLRGGVVFIKEIPRNHNGKILRKDLRSWSQSKL